MRERARATNLIERERKFDVVALFYTLSLGFAAGSDCTIQAFLERYVEMADCDELSYSSFHEWFSPTFVALLRENLDPDRNQLRGRLERVRDVFIVDETFLSLYQDAGDVYVGYRDEHPGAKLHVVESLSTGLPTRWRTTDGTVDERSQLLTGEWVADSLLLFDLGYYSFWLFDRIDANDG